MPASSATRGVSDCWGEETRPLNGKMRTQSLTSLHGSPPRDRAGAQEQRQSSLGREAGGSRVQSLEVSFLPSFHLFPPCVLKMEPGLPSRWAGAPHTEQHPTGPATTCFERETHRPQRRSPPRAALGAGLGGCRLATHNCRNPECSVLAGDRCPQDSGWLDPTPSASALPSGNLGSGLPTAHYLFHLPVCSASLSEQLLEDDPETRLTPASEGYKGGPWGSVCKL